MFKKFRMFILLSVLSFSCSTVWAIPTLQLDIGGGSYDSSTETVFSNGDIFTLYAYLIPDSNNALDDIYYISAALTPKTSVAADYGTFTFDGDIVDVTDDMVFGKPPVNVLSPDLGSHGIYETFYKEISFTFDSSDTAAQANSEDTAGAGPQAGTGMYFKAFSIDTSSLADGYEIHFDLYSIYMHSNESLKIEHVPYSHDAQSYGNTPVPEPATMFLFVLGMASLLGVSAIKDRKRMIRRKVRNSSL